MRFWWENIVKDFEEFLGWLCGDIDEDEDINSRQVDNTSSEGW